MMGASAAAIALFVSSSKARFRFLEFGESLECYRETASAWYGDLARLYLRLCPYVRYRSSQVSLS
jgi:hypothetical protein